MADFFGDISDSDVSEVRSTCDDVSGDEDEYAKAFEKWRKLPSDKSDSVKHNEASKPNYSMKEKAEEEIRRLCETIDVSFAAANWVECANALTTLSKTLPKFITKYNHCPLFFLEILTELIKEMGLNDEGNSKEGKPGWDRDSFNDKYEWVEYKSVLKTVHEMSQLYQTSLKSMDEDPETGAVAVEVMKTWTEQDMFDELHKPNRTYATCLKVRRAAQAKEGYDRIVFASYVHQCDIMLDDRTALGVVSPHTWQGAYEALDAALGIAKTKNFTLDMKVTVTTDGLENSKERKLINPSRFFVVAIKLYDAVVKACQYASPNAPEYFKFVRFEASASRIIDNVLDRYIKSHAKQGIRECAIALLRIVSVRRNEAHKELINIEEERTQFLVMTPDLGATVAQLSELMATSKPDDEMGMQLSLLQLYQAAINDDFHTCRDGLLRLHPQESMKTRPMETRILYNRVVAQLALCAFRAGLFSDASWFFTEIITAGVDLRELIGQKDVVRMRMNWEPYSVERERDDRKRLVCPHHAVPVRLLEVAHLVLAMLSDTVIETKNPNEKNSKTKEFYSLMKACTACSLSGPPVEDNGKIFAAHEALLRGDCTQAVQLISSLHAWEFLYNKEATLDPLIELVKYDSLKIFLIKFGSSFASLTVNRLSVKFGLPKDIVRAQVSRLLLDQTIVGHWDHDAHCLIIERGTQSKLHHLSADCSERINGLAMYNTESGPSFPRHERGGRGRGRGRGRGHGRGN